VLQLPLMKYVGFNQRQTAIRHFQGLFRGAICDVKQFLISLAFQPDALLHLSTDNAPETVGIEPEAELFVPVLLLCREEDERLTTIAALAPYVEVMSNRHGRR